MAKIFPLLQPAQTALLFRRRHGSRNLPRDALRCREAMTQGPEINIQGVPASPALLTSSLPSQGGGGRPLHPRRYIYILNTKTGRELRSPAPLLCFNACLPPLAHNYLSRPNCPIRWVHLRENLVYATPSAGQKNLHDRMLQG